MKQLEFKRKKENINKSQDNIELFKESYEIKGLKTLKPMKSLNNPKTTSCKTLNSHNIFIQRKHLEKVLKIEDQNKPKEKRSLSLQLPSL
jgi:hypothetical protein